MVSFLDMVDDVIEICEDDELCGDIFEGCCYYNIYVGDFNVLCILSYFVINLISFMLSFIFVLEVNVMIW